MFDGVEQGSIASSACCPAGTYWIDGSSVCTDCAAGKYADQPGGTAQSACKDCAEGKYNDQLGSMTEDACKQCDNGQFTSGAASTAESDCKDWVKVISTQDMLSELSIRQGSCNGQ